jgi:imidazoleglycerol-phosphate dehydratase
MAERKAEVKRKTGETDISVTVLLDGSGAAQVDTGIGFLNHMLTSLSKHSGIDITLKCKGDLEVDDHHTAEDCAVAIGQAMDGALGDRRGIRRFGSAYAPLDEALARAVVDLSGRPYAALQLGLKGDKIGALNSENVGHVLQSLAFSARATLHVDVIRGENDHHRAEACFKALALALKNAVALGSRGDVPSTKGVL